MMSALEFIFDRKKSKPYPKLGASELWRFATWLKPSTAATAAHCSGTSDIWKRKALCRFVQSTLAATALGVNQKRFR